ncbi:hypothetical protein [Roseateles terrae]|uniref:Uncharacterized protein n=1 Tax=Roseateles terrae TaxID=431060 RepID=A0ABR6GXJ1_9BURK|nr:hypothetical protein [Roseateles terrae]MBB3196826.1 hypothetical protein [Roseateles terrae]
MDKNTMGASLGSAMNAPLPTSMADTEHLAYSGSPVAQRPQISHMRFAAAPATPAFKPSHCVSAELLLSTPLTVVVRAHLDYVDADGREQQEEVALVISRNRCEGDQPYWPALLSAAQEHWHRCRGLARRMTACVDGEWQTLLAAQAEGTSTAPAAPVQARMQH